MVEFGSISLPHFTKSSVKMRRDVYAHMAENESRTTFCKISASLSTKAGLAIIERRDDAIDCPICQQKIDGEEKNCHAGSEALQCPVCRLCCSNAIQSHLLSHLACFGFWKNERDSVQERTLAIY